VKDYFSVKFVKAEINVVNYFPVFVFSKRFLIARSRLVNSFLESGGMSTFSISIREAFGLGRKDSIIFSASSTALMEAVKSSYYIENDSIYYFLIAVYILIWLVFSTFESFNVLRELSKSS